MLETDAFNNAIGAVLFQHASSEGSLLLPVAFYHKKLNSAEQNYYVHDYEMLAIIQACNKWRSHLINKEVVVYTDHNLSSTCKHNPSSTPARCISWIL